MDCGTRHDVVALAREIMQSDADTYGHQFPAYRADPLATPAIEIERAEDAGPLFVECSKERHEEMRLRVGEPAYFRLRNSRIFPPDAKS